MNTVCIYEINILKCFRQKVGTGKSLSVVNTMDLVIIYLTNSTVPHKSTYTSI